VGHEPQAQLAVAVIGVLIQFAPQADVGEVSEFNHALRVGGGRTGGILCLCTDKGGAAGQPAAMRRPEPGTADPSKDAMNAAWRPRLNGRGARAGACAPPARGGTATGAPGPSRR